MKARMALLLAVVVVLVGLAPVVYFVALFAWQMSLALQAGTWIALPATLMFTEHAPAQASKAAPLLPFIPEIPWAWLKNPDGQLPLHMAVKWALDSVHALIVFALVGLYVMWRGFLGAVRQMPRLRAEKQGREDRLRRARDYRRDVAETDIVDRVEPFIGGGGLGGKRDRRVA